MKKQRTFSLVPFVIPALFLLLWHIAAVKANNQVVVPPPEQVGELFASPFASVIGMGSLASNILVSLARVLTGYALAVAVGIPLGIAMGHSPLSHELLNLFLSLFRPIPPLAWAPLVLAWFGVAGFATMAGVEEGALFVPLNNLKLSMLFIIFIGAVYPILSGAIHGVRGVRTILIDSARTLGASDRDIFRLILLPGAMPSIVMASGSGSAWPGCVSSPRKCFPEASPAWGTSSRTRTRSLGRTSSWRGWSTSGSWARFWTAASGGLRKGNSSGFA